MKRLYRYWIQTIMTLATLLCPATVTWSAIVIQDVSPADVTPSGFSVVWQTSGSTVPGITLYADPGGITEITDQLEVTPLPLSNGSPEIIGEYEREVDMEAIRSHIRTKGLMKIRIQGCVPGTTYYYRISAEGPGGEIAYWPASTLSSVTTARENAFVADSKQMLLTINDQGGAVDPTGWMVLAYSSVTPLGVSSYVGDGAGAYQAYINLSNLFESDGRNWVPSGSRNVTVEVRRGTDAGTIFKTFPLDYSNNFSVSTLYAVTADEQLDDTDHDGIPDSWETLNGLDPSDPNDASSDDDSDGLTNLAEYQNGTDPHNQDTDGDGLSDGWEAAQGLNPLDDGSIDPNNGPNGDPDVDGSTNVEEFQAGSNPMNVDSLPVNMNIILHQGFNIFGYPVTTAAGLRSYDLLEALGDPTEIDKVLVYDKVSGDYRTAYYDINSPAGDNVDIGYGDGIIVYSKTDKTVSFNPTTRPSNSYIECAPVDFAAGLNVTTFPCVPTGLTAFQLLQAIGNETVVGSIQRFNTTTGRFETAGYRNGQPVGMDFSIQAGEGYFVHMKQGVPGFRP